MINIRNGVFETNSSSSHSICINNANQTVSADLSAYIDDNGMWSINGIDLEFYRAPFRVLTSPEAKIRYAIACTAYLGKESDKFQMIEQTVQEIEPKFKHFVFLPSKWFGGSDPDMGGTDESILFPWLEENHVNLKEFITSGKYFVVCDGDEYNIFSDLVKTGIVNKAIQHDDYGSDDYEWYNSAL